ncbi:DUF2634 domain-containing protein [Fusobacterium polymorphum]|jgi:hypothetical protein|uniref:DUF2634 domain-containing protein n=1 Tax=Fusobacterium nucleatum subsp. polymorphum TaxID=76857 RepID=UPI0030D02605
MGILPKIDFVDYSKQDTNNSKNSNGKTFLIDFQKKKLLKSNGQLIKTDDERAVRMWIEKVLLTEKYKWNIYKSNGPNQYGMKYKDMLLSQRFPTPVLYSEFERELTETMKKNKQIIEIRNIDIKLEKHTLKTKFEVVLKDFKIFEWEGYL